MRRHLLSFSALAAVWCGLNLLPRASCQTTPAAGADPSSSTPSATTTKPSTRETVDSTTRPVVAGDPYLRTRLKQLNDRDPVVRANAVFDLKGMSSRQLDSFRELVAASRPLAPSQAIMLHDIVVHCRMANQPYASLNGETTATGTTGPFFFGIHWSTGDDNARLGVPIEDRLLGFPGFQSLRDGDMILGIIMDPTKPLLDPPNTETHIPTMLRMALSNAPEVQNVALEVLRDGEQIRVHVKLAPRPTVFAEPDAMIQFELTRQHSAETYWTESFVPLLSDAADKQ